MSDEARGHQWGVHSIDKVQHIPKGAIGDFQRGAGRWASKSDHRRRTCVVTRLNRNRVVEILRLAGCDNLISQRKEFIFNAFVYFQPV